MQFDSNTSLPLTQHPEDNGVCSCEVLLRALRGMADTSSKAAVVPADHASGDAKQGECTLKETQESCANSGIAMEYTAAETPQQKKISERYRHNLTTKSECTLTGGNNAPEEASIKETERQRAQIPDIEPEEDTVNETE